MVNSAEEAEAFVSYCRYPPRGQRSFGPIRARLYAGADYGRHANEEVLASAMIETRAALDALDAILAVPGLDGVYVGPSDLSASLGLTPQLDPDDGEVLEGLSTLPQATK